MEGVWGGLGWGGVEQENRNTSGDAEIHLEEEACCSVPNPQRRDEISAAAHVASARQSEPTTGVLSSANK